MIEAVNGKRIAGYTEYEDEDEVILPIGTQLRVEADPLIQADGSYLVHLVEIDDDDDDDQPTASNSSGTHPVASSSSGKYPVAAAAAAATTTTIQTTKTFSTASYAKISSKSFQAFLIKMKLCRFLITPPHAIRNREDKMKILMKSCVRLTIQEMFKRSLLTHNE